MTHKHHRFYYHEGISIEPLPLTLLLAYADADQGGTRLQYHYRIYYSENQDRKAKITLTYGYAHENKHKTEHISLSDIHQTVIGDALTWLKRQLGASKDSGKEKHQKIFTRFIEIIESGND
jgi:hypothetical protein